MVTVDVMIRFKIARISQIGNVSQRVITTPKREKDGVSMPRYHVKVKKLERKNAVAFMAFGNRGRHVISLVFIKIKNQFEQGSVIVMIP